MISRRAALSSKLSLVSFQAEALYHRGHAFLDDAGRMTADLEDYRATIIPKGKRGKAIPLSQVQSVIDELFGVGLIGLCECPGKRCMEYAKFSEFNIIKKDRNPQIDCLEPVGFQWKTLEDNGALIEVKGREYKGGEEDARAREELPPHLSTFVEEARKISGWKFTVDQELKFFEALAADFPADVITKVTKDLAAFQLSEKQPKKNPMRALRNWCSKEMEWRKECGELQPPPKPARDNGRKRPIPEPPPDPPMSDRAKAMSQELASKLGVPAAVREKAHDEALKEAWPSLGSESRETP
jgi:hypothetical protein